MYQFLIIFAVIVCLIGLAATLLLGRQETIKAKQYEQNENRSQAQLMRSQQYEKSSLKENVPLLTAIYGITFLIVIVLILLFVVDVF